MRFDTNAFTHLRISPPPKRFRRVPKFIIRIAFFSSSNFFFPLLSLPLPRSLSHSDTSWSFNLYLHIKRYESHLAAFNTHKCIYWAHAMRRIHSWNFFNSQESNKCETQKCWCSKYVADNSYEDIFFLGFSKSVGKKGMPKLCRVVMLWPNQYESVKLDFRWNERRKSHRHMCRIFNLALTWQCHTLPLPTLSLLTFAGTYFDCDIPISLGNKWNARVG